MIISPVADLSITVSNSGRLELFSPANGGQLACEGPGLARWLALRLNGGHVDAAAEMLSKLWGASIVDIQLELVSWVHELYSIGLIREVEQYC